MLIFAFAVFTFSNPARAAAPCAALLWNQALSLEMKADTLAPPLVARNLAILHAAIERAHTLSPKCSEAVLHLVSYKICTSLLPAHSPAFDQLLTRSSPAAIPDADREFAETCALPVLETLTKDGASTHVTYLAKQRPGAWCRTSPFFRAAEMPHWGTVKPMFLQSAGQFRPLGPPALVSETYAKALDEVRRFGGRHGSQRSPDQTEAAAFWSDFSYTETPVGHWHSIARQLALQQNLPPRECARLFYVLSASLSDTAIACWEAKYTYDFWRPITALQKAEEDGNPDTTPDPEWVPLLNTPSHPEYVSGHSAFSGAASQTLDLFFGTDHLEFEVQSDTLPQVRRKFDSLKKCALECGESRIYGGIHFRFSCEDGFALGRNVADWVWSQREDARSGSAATRSGN